MNLVEKVKGFLLKPGKTFESSKEDSLTEAMKYYIIISMIFSALVALMSYFFPELFSPMISLKEFGLTQLTGFEEAALLWILGVIGIFLSGCSLHIFVYMSGGRKGITSTIKAVVYGSTPGLLFGWIPFIYVKIIAGLWSLHLLILGTSKLQEITRIKSSVAMIVISILETIILFAAFLVFLGTVEG